MRKVQKKKKNSFYQIKKVWRVQEIEKITFEFYSTQVIFMYFIGSDNHKALNIYVKLAMGNDQLLISLALAALIILLYSYTPLANNNLSCSFESILF